MASQTDRLPAPDQFGNYYFGPPSDLHRPAVLRIEGFLHQRGKYLASTGERVLFGSGGEFLAFATPEEAMAAVRRAMTADLWLDGATS
jgi:hypothetical protein